MLIRKLKKREIPEAISLVWEVFSEFEAPEYSAEGVESFRKTISSDEFINMIEMYGAFEDNKLVGASATRNGGNHIALFFVKPQWHRQGIGRMMFETILQNCKSDTVTVNSSPFAVKVYRRLGFIPTADELLLNGIRFLPMEYTRTI